MSGESIPKPSAHFGHELRTPLNHVIGYSELLIEEAEDRGATAFVEELRRLRAAGKKLLAILDNILSLPQFSLQILRLRSARDEFSALANQISQPLASLHSQAEKNGLSVFVPDLNKIEAATKNFLALVEQYSATDESADNPQTDEHKRLP